MRRQFNLSDAEQNFNMVIWGNNNNYVPKQMTWKLMRERIIINRDFFIRRNNLGDLDKAIKLNNLLGLCPFRKNY